MAGKNENYFEEHDDERLNTKNVNTPTTRETVKKSPTYYPSNLQGHFIRNAITGALYPWRVGSKDSRRLFKVVDAMGKMDSNGFRIKARSENYPNPNPNHCYYNSPKEYMDNRKMLLTPQLLQRWEESQKMFAEAEPAN